MKKHLILLFVLLAFLLVPSDIMAADEIAVLDTSVDTFFPSGMVFNIEAQSSSNITDIRLHYQVDRINIAETTSEGWAKFSPAPRVKTKWTWDMRKAPLPPGATLKYWWTLEDSKSNKLTTPIKSVAFSDTRRTWQSINSGMLTLYWYEGSRTYADLLMDACKKGLDRLASDTGARPEAPIRIYIYANSQDLQGAMIFPNEWTGGAAYTEFGIIAIGISQAQLAWGLRAVAHELTHMVIHQITFGPYGDTLPTWLDEGLAQYGEGDPDPDLLKFLKRYVSQDRLISVRSLSGAFSAISEEAYLSYAESDNIVRYLIQTYGRDKMLRLLTLFKEGNTYDDALQQAYGFDTEGLDARWRAYVKGALQSRSGLVVEQPEPAYLTALIPEFAR